MAMANITPFPSFSPKETRSSAREAAMTDFISIIQALKATLDGDQNYCARDFLVEKLEGVYRTLEELGDAEAEQAAHAATGGKDAHH